MNEARSTIITVVAVDIGESDGNFADFIELSEVDRPPRECLALLRARECVHVSVNSEVCRLQYGHLNCFFVRRIAVCETCIHNYWLRFSSHYKVCIDKKLKNSLFTIYPETFHNDLAVKIYDAKEDELIVNVMLTDHYTEKKLSTV